jgi:hypothetical protein
VYVSEPEPLEAGQAKHVISVFVADEAGLINRVAGVFARRGAAWGRVCWGRGWWWLGQGRMGRGVFSSSGEAGLINRVAGMFARRRAAAGEKRRAAVGEGVWGEGCMR